MSISTRWNPPCRHLDTASRPLTAVCHLTFSRRMNCSSSFMLIWLSSTIRTLMGGTEVSMYGVRLAFRRAAAVAAAVALGVVEVVVGASEGSVGWRSLILRFGAGRGLATRGVGGLERGFAV